MTRRRMSNKPALLVGGVLLIAVVFGLEAGYRVVTAPWSIDYGGRDTLLGPWAGTMRARQGAEYGLYLNLEYLSPVGNRIGRRSRGRGPRDNLEGHATLCTPTGERFDYAARGRADHTGKVEDLWLEYGDPRLSALNLLVTGAWQNRVLTLTTNKNPFLPDGRFVAQRTLSSSDPDDSFGPITLTERDRAAFEATCQRLRA